MRNSAHRQSPPPPVSCRPQVAIGIDPDAVGASGAHVDEASTVRDEVPSNLENPNLTDVDDVEQALVGAEAQAVRAVHVADDHGGIAGVGVEAVHVPRQLQFGALSPSKLPRNAIARIGEPHRPVGLHHDVVRRVQRLAIESIEQHGDRPVVLGASDPTPEVLTGSTGPARPGCCRCCCPRVAERPWSPRFLAPAQHPIVRDVGEQQIAAVAEPDRPFEPAAAGPESFHHALHDPQCGESRVDGFHRGIGESDDRPVLLPGLGRFDLGHDATSCWRRRDAARPRFYRPNRSTAGTKITEQSGDDSR